MSLLSTLSSSVSSISSLPLSQTGAARPISFYLTIDGSQEPSVDLLVRPEDLQWTEPARTSVNQSLGGAWVDNFGPGIPAITISGHTGWRPVGADMGWEGRFDDLYQQVWKKYHDAIAQLKDPTKVKLEFVDVLDRRAAVVTPNQFVLKRNRSRPLLKQYNISMTQVAWSNDPVDRISVDPQSEVLKALRLAAVAAATAAATARLLIKDAASYDAYKVLEFAYLAANTALVAAEEYDAVSGVVSTLVSASGLASAASSAVSTVSTVAGVVAGSSAAGLASSLLRASNYMSVAASGGTSGVTSVVQSSAAMRATAALSGSDPVLAPLSTAEVVSHIDTITAGTKVS